MKKDFKGENIKDNLVKGAHQKLKWHLVYLLQTPVFNSGLGQGSGLSFLLSGTFYPDCICTNAW